MKPEECPYLDECRKVRMIFDHDLLDFQYADAIREICAGCTEGKATSMNVDTLERQMRDPDFIKRHIFEALYAGVAEWGGDIELAKQLRARTKFRLINMSDEQLLAFVTAIAPPEKSIEAVYESFQKAKAEHSSSACEWMRDLPPHTGFQEEDSNDV
jgi:hypothetical protein